ncbi:putative ABC transporter ATP-binding protein [Gordonia araii NBRC 100433]|uniref:Putative ABC transporter ATP-binding protein n=1 Tax=Gordonia araii NBRC 100433 TaxID=1073574 RepID=G7GXV7_9ACTN|nr:ATP-binding cassette domain-containing protein [Gordonia araii]NNG98372.1 ATP-binding cassette domain-containing protein [Gordonia araii NBRC 100433]GAB08432.1 putative ABC transporter ATP-binding protein [Gordonia araii NBRC 100433]
MAGDEEVGGWVVYDRSDAEPTPNTPPRIQWHVESAATRQPVSGAQRQVGDPWAAEAPAAPAFIDDAPTVPIRPAVPRPTNITPSSPVTRTGRHARVEVPEQPEPVSSPNITPVAADAPEVYDDYYGSEPVTEIPAEPPSGPPSAPISTGWLVEQTPVPPRTSASRVARTRVPLSAPAIEATGLTKSFDGQIAVDGVTFSVASGSVLALLGPNGAGKTTTVNLLTTLLKPDSGSASVAGHDVVKAGGEVRRRIALTGQFAALDESLSGRENLVLFGRLHGLRKAQAQQRADELLAQFDLVEAGAKRVSEYSGGMRRRVDLACGLVTSPEVVFLDEPTTGLDPRSRQDVWNLVERLREQGVTILLTTQYLEEADLLSDEIVVIDHGRIIAAGTAEQLKNQTGSSYCQVTPAHLTELRHLESVLADLLGHTGHRDDVSLSVPAPSGTDVLVEIVRRTTDAGIELADITMRRPSLDDVFLALTGPGNQPPGTR